MCFNFMLTKRRSRLLFEVRQMKKTGRIERYYSDENGAIAIKVKSTDKSKKLSSIHEEGSSRVRTYLLTELHEEVPQLQAGPEQQVEQQQEPRPQRQKKK